MDSAFYYPDKALPHSPRFSDAEEYVTALLDFLTTSHMLQTLCGGVHILDFMTRKQDLYTSILPTEWRQWLEDVAISDLLDLLMRENLADLFALHEKQVDLSNQTGAVEFPSWRAMKDLPPKSLLQYIDKVRHLSLDRTFQTQDSLQTEKQYGLSREVSVGMRPKKAHEVANFASFVNGLAEAAGALYAKPISHILDFGSGQNYLGRVLASPVYSKQVIAVEKRHLNVEGSKRMDILAKLSEKQVIWRNKKMWKSTGSDDAQLKREADQIARITNKGISPTVLSSEGDKQEIVPGVGKILYVEHEITDGNLDPVIMSLNNESTYGDAMSLGNSWKDFKGDVTNDKSVLCISLHSCGNLSHHGLRALILNSFVKGVALIGCCYNLVTERLGPPTYKIPSLRQSNRRLETISSARDPHGFPMSERMAQYSHEGGRGIRLNITARMMAVQAPQNWTKSDSDSFFTRHFFRALLQRIFLDKGLIGAPDEGGYGFGGVSPAGGSAGGEPIIIGSLRKSCYLSFVSYVRGACKKLEDDPVWGKHLQNCMNGLSDHDIAQYELRFQNKRHHLSIIWSLMAFSAGVVESAIVTDRWLFLKEQPCVQKCWVQTAFEYTLSPRNLVIVGMK